MISKIYYTLDLETTNEYSFVGISHTKCLETCTLDEIKSKNLTIKINDYQSLNEFEEILSKILNNPNVILCGHNIVKYDFIVLFSILHIKNCLEMVYTPLEMLNKINFHEVIQKITKWIIEDRKIESGGLIAAPIIGGKRLFHFLIDVEPPIEEFVIKIPNQYQNIFDIFEITIFRSIYRTPLSLKSRRINIPCVECTIVDTNNFYKHSLKDYAIIEHKDYHHQIDLESSFEEMVNYNIKDLYYTLKLLGSSDVQNAIKSRIGLIEKYSIGTTNPATKRNKILTCCVQTQHLANLSISCKLNKSYFDKLYKDNVQLRYTPFHYIDMDGLVYMKGNRIASIKRRINNTIVEKYCSVDGDDNNSSVTITDKHGEQHVIPFMDGGLHYMNPKYEKVHLISNQDFTYINLDVASYYPALMLQTDTWLAEEIQVTQFLGALKGIVIDRLKAKANAKNGINKDFNKEVSASLKLAVNSAYGKSAKTLRNSVTFRGQLYFLELITFAIEELELDIISVNTDGLFIRCPTLTYKEDVRLITERMKSITKTQSFELELEVLKHMYQINVSSCFRITTGGNVERKKDFKIDKGSIGKQTSNLIAETLFQMKANNKTMDEVIKDVIKNTPHYLMKSLGVQKLQGGNKASLYKETCTGWVKTKGKFWLCIGNAKDSFKLIGRTHKPIEKTGKYSIMKIRGRFNEVNEKTMTQAYLELNIDHIKVYLEEEINNLEKNTGIEPTINNLNLYVIPKLTLIIEERIKSIQAITLSDLEYRIMEDPEHKKQIEVYRAIAVESFKKVVKTTQLPAVYTQKPKKNDEKTNWKRTKTVISNKSLILFDIDSKGMGEKQPLDIKNEIIRKIPESIMAYISCSGKGVHFIIAINKRINYPQLYKNIIKVLISEYEKILDIKIDPASSEMGKPFIISHDKALKSNDKPKVKNIDSLINKLDISPYTDRTFTSKIDHININKVDIDRVSKIFKDAIVKNFEVNDPHMIRLHGGNVSRILMNIGRNSNKETRKKINIEIEAIKVFTLSKGRQDPVHLTPANEEYTSYIKSLIRNPEKAYKYLLNELKPLFTTSKSIPIELENTIKTKENKIFIVPTGCGKTFSVIQLSTKNFKQPTIIFIYTPTKVLAEQVYKQVVQTIYNNKTSHDRSIFLITNKKAIRFSPIFNTTQAIYGISIVNRLHEKHNIIVLNSPLLENPIKTQDTPTKKNKHNSEDVSYARVTGLLEAKEFNKILFIDEVDAVLNKGMKKYLICQEFYNKVEKNGYLEALPIKKDSVKVGLKHSPYSQIGESINQIENIHKLKISSDENLKTRMALGRKLHNMLNFMKDRSLDLRTVGMSATPIKTSDISELIDADGDENMNKYIHTLQMAISKMSDPFILRVENHKKSKNHTPKEVYLMGYEDTFLKKLKLNNIQLIGLTATWIDNSILRQVRRKHDIAVEELIILFPEGFTKPELKLDLALNDHQLKQHNRQKCGVEMIADLYNEYKKKSNDSNRKLLIVCKTKELAIQLHEYLYRNNDTNSKLITSDGVISKDSEDEVNSVEVRTFITFSYSGLSRGINWNEIMDIFLCFSIRPNSSIESIVTAIDNEILKNIDDINKTLIQENITKAIIDTALQVVGRIIRLSKEENKKKIKTIFFYNANRMVKKENDLEIDQFLKPTLSEHNVNFK